MSKPLDKMLKNELVAMVQQQASRLHAQDLELAQLRNDLALGCADIRPTTSELMDEIVSLREKLTATENRRKYESIAYRKRIKAARPVSDFAARIAAKRSARERYFADNPEARTCTDADLVPYLEA